MSYKLSRAIWAGASPEIMGSDRYVLHAFATFANDDGSGVFPSRSTVAEMCGLSLSTVARAVDFLREAGVLVEVKRGRHGQKVYRISLSGSVRMTHRGSQDDTAGVSRRHGESVKMTRDQGQDDTRPGSRWHTNLSGTGQEPVTDPISEDLSKYDQPKAEPLSLMGTRSERLPRRYEFYTSAGATITTSESVAAIWAAKGNGRWLDD